MGNMSPCAIPPLVSARWTASRLARLLPSLVLSAALVAPGAGAAEGALEAGGSLRTIGAGIDNYDEPALFGAGNGADGLMQTLLRITAESAGRDGRLTWEGHVVEAFDLFTGGGGTAIPVGGDGGADASGSSAFDLAPKDVRYRGFDLTWNPVEEGDVSDRLWIDRLNVRLALPGADITVGRQAITYGKAYFWNPLDVFLPFDPRQFDRDYKPGVDAVRIQVALGLFSGLEVVGAAGREIDAGGSFVGGGGFFDATWYGSAFLGRVFTTVSGWDVALQGGKVYGGYQAGGAFVGEIGPLEVRGEAAYLIARGGPALPAPLEGDLVESGLTAVAGLGHRFESSLTLEGEYLYNGEGDPDDLAAASIRFDTGGTFHLGRHLVGLLGTYEVLPILTGRLGGLLSLSDGSGQIQPAVVYSAADEVDLLAGALVNFGERPTDSVGDPYRIPGLRSEFGTFPDVYYLEFKVYF
jgi:hypothetical protein